MITKRTVWRMAIVGFLAAIAIAGAVAFTAHGGGQTGTYSNGMINGESLTKAPIAPLDPGFTGGPPLQPNMGTKPPAVANP